MWAGLAASGQVIGAHDLLIAATALVQGYDVLTDNVREFGRVPGLAGAEVADTGRVVRSVEAKHRGTAEERRIGEMEARQTVGEAIALEILPVTASVVAEPSMLAVTWPVFCWLWRAMVTERCRYASTGDVLGLVVWHARRR